MPRVVETQEEFFARNGARLYDDTTSRTLFANGAVFHHEHGLMQEAPNDPHERSRAFIEYALRKIEEYKLYSRKVRRGLQGLEAIYADSPAYYRTPDEAYEKLKAWSKNIERLDRMIIIKQERLPEWQQARHRERLQLEAQQRAAEERVEINRRLPEIPEWK
ncbi:hypothetical protein [Crateriforma spongiae]|uniref:hypothetical protein n=1 Tax=Crateriforma spongiae TaxID=2724528 RepID=UPI001445A680|nr:hypothetical protein [Crateriforma spongiae]